jgi:hypothetical protein
VYQRLEVLPLHQLGRWQQTFWRRCSEERAQPAATCPPPQVGGFADLGANEISRYSISRLPKALGHDVPVHLQAEQIKKVIRSTFVHFGNDQPLNANAGDETAI